jgi:hypothetical protein
MEGIIKKIEGVDLNDLSHEELQEVVTSVASEYKELESNTERWAQSLLGEKKKLEKAIDTFKNVNSNPEALDKLMESDPEIWQFIIDKFFDGKSIDEIKKKTNIDDIVDQRLNQKEVEKKLSSVREQLPEDLIEKFDEEFKDLTEGKKLSSENVQKYIKNALSNISEDGDLVNTIRATAVGNGWSPKTWRPTNEDRAAKSVREHLKAMWQIK